MDYEYDPINALTMLSTGSTQEDPSLFNWKIVDGT